MKPFLVAAMTLLTATTAYASQEAAIAGIGTEWAADWSAGKLDAVMALYAPDPIFDPAGGTSWEGKSDIRKHFAEVLAQLKADLKLTSRRTQSEGNLGYDSGTYDEELTSLKDGKKLHSRGTYLFLLVRAPNEGWKILEQTWTGSEPSEL